ncbi:hypothetical protein BY458DRAFT_256690 [Sporodiniella umbellata]|nr:hypothetical protein BY458DRAFT_256690 [Sporodiniella umbellata]
MGTGEGTNEMPDHLLDELRKRPVYYPSQRPKEIAACGHPLHHGGLCPRKDLVTCPIHGKIVPRDELGRPLIAEGSAVPKTAPHPPATQHAMDNLWELLESDVMAQTGQQQIMPRGQKRKQTALIDIKKKPETSFTRLDRKMNTSKNRRNIQEAAEYERLMKSQAREASHWR